MKNHNLYLRIHDFKNLHSAYLATRKNKRYRQEILQFSYQLEKNLISIQKDLMTKNYQVSSYRRFYIYEPKKREIMALPFRDRIIQQALCQIIEPILERSFIFDSYACRKMKGIHVASSRLTQFLRRGRKKWGEKFYCLKADISRFFPSINRQILFSLLKKKIHCKDTLSLIEKILFSDSMNNKGLPIGNLTSQIWANVYLNELDHFIKENLRKKLYLRYMDDFIILDSDKNQLKDNLRKTDLFLKINLALNLNSKTSIFPILRGIDFVGYRHWLDYRLPRKQSLLRIKRQFKKTKNKLLIRKISINKYLASIASWKGYLQHADTFKLRQRLFQK